MATVLIVEDEAAIAETLIYALKTDGQTVHWLSLGQAALERLSTGDIDLVVLDIGLPDISGFEVCRQLRRVSDCPVLFLTARADEIDRIVGLELGGDDYVSKPFSPREVAARVRTILRRSQPRAVDNGDKASVAPLFSVEAEKGVIRYRGETLRLTRYEFLLLAVLLEQPERIFSRAQLMDKVWQDALETDERTVDTHIKTLRGKLRAVTDSDPIVTHRGLGYSISAKP